MIVTRSDGIVVQGITGRQGTFWTERMLAAGTRILAGVSPGNGGQEVHGVQVYDAVAAAAAQPVSVSVLFTPPLTTKAAALEALKARLARLVLLAEFVPYQDMMEVIAEARARAQVLGPNTAGLVFPGVASIGVMPGYAPNIFRPGNVGVISRSGSLGTLVCLNVVRAGCGQSAFIGIGGDPILGTTTVEALRLLDAHEPTEAVVIVGEVGGAMEEEAAEYARQMTKPVLAVIAGRAAPPGKRMGHAGAIVMGGMGSWESKTSALRAAGVKLLDSPSEIGAGLDEVLGAGPRRAQGGTD